MEDRGTGDLERRYRHWLRLYPRQYREERGEEILQTLLELSQPGQHSPTPREAAAVALQGLRVRAKTARAVPASRLWLAALPLTAGLLLIVRILELILVLPVALANAALPTAGDLALVAWPAVSAALVLAAVHRHRNRLAILLAATSAPATVLLAALTGALGPVPGSLAGPEGVDLAYQSLPAVLLLPLLLSPGGRPVPWRWQLGAPLLLAAPMLAMTFARSWNVDLAHGSVLCSTPVLVILALLALLGVLLWGALVDGCAALAVSLCLLVIDATNLGTTSATATAAQWGSLAVIGGAALALAGAGAYRVHQQAVG